MPRKIDLVGQRFGYLTVLYESENRIITPNGRSHVTWTCQCDCGNIIDVRSDMLRSGSVTSCGCRRKSILRQSGINRKIDLTNQQFGYLLVLEDTNKRTSKGEIIWKCQCECGNVVEVVGGNLTRKTGGTISCGCKKSKGEKKLIDIFIANQILFVTQKRFSNCINPDTNRQLVFDFYLPEYKTLIEYDGEQHFHKVKNDRYNFEEIYKRDKYKEQWCKNNHIKLIRIPYFDFEKITYDYIISKLQDKEEEV